MLVINTGGFECGGRLEPGSADIRCADIDCGAGIRTPSADSGGGSGTITFKGKVSGKMTISACPGGGIAQLAVDVDGQGSTYKGVIDADDFTIVGPKSTAYTLAEGASKPTYPARRTP